MKKKKKKHIDELIETYRGDGAAPACPHFGECGGCMFQNIPYENQLLLKKDYINTTMNGRVSVESVAPSEPYRYRNRMDMVTAFGSAGLRQAGRYRNVVDVTTCAIMQEKSDSLFKKIRPLIRGVEDYDYLVHKGYLRYVVLRQGYFTGEVMANFVIKSEEDRLGEVVESILPDADSISILVSDGMADLSFGRIMRDVKKGFIEESFDGIRYRITPNSFFQSNSPMALSVYRRMKQEVEGDVLDLYSGVGSISLFVAGGARHVTGVEVVDEAVRSADGNRDMNGISNVSFVCADVKEYLLAQNRVFDTVILDPPRSGMHPKVLKAVVEQAPQKILYLSCNPSTFKEELAAFERYDITSFEAFDMFPQTPHLETLAVLKRKD